MKRALRHLSSWPPEALLALVGAVALAVWLSAGVWGGRAPPGDDIAARLVGASVGIDLLSQGRVDGWQPNFGLGYEAFLFIGPGFAWTVAAVRGLTFGLVSTTGALTAVVVGSFVALPLAVAFLARSIGLTRTASGISAVLSLAVSGPWAGVGLHSLFTVGLVANQVGALWWCLTLGAVVRQLDDSRLGWVVLAGVSGAVLVLTHIVSALVLALVAATIVVLNAAVPRHLRRSGTGSGHESDQDGGTPLAVAARLGLSALLALALSSVMLVPLVAHRDLQGPFTGVQEPPPAERLAMLWRGEVIVAPGVVPWVVMGMAFGVALALRGRPRYLALVLVPMAHLVVAHAALSRWPESLIARQLPTRGLGYLAILALFPLAALLATAGRRLGDPAPLAAVVGAAALVVLPLGWPVARPSGAQPGTGLLAAAHYLGEVVPDGARFATQRDFPDEITATGVSHPDFWLAWLSGHNTLNIFNAESTVVGAPVFEPELIGQVAPEVSADALARLGVTHVVLVDEAEAAALVSSSRFERVWRSPPLAILTVEPRPGRPPPSSLLAGLPATARLVRADSERLVIEAETDRGGEATVAVGWSPKWHARLDGRPVALGPTDDGLLSVALPAGRHTLALDFEPDWWDRLGLAVTLASGLGLLVGVRWMRRRRAPGTLGTQRGGWAPVCLAWRSRHTRPTRRSSSRRRTCACCRANTPSPTET